MKLTQQFPSELDIEDLHVKDNIRKEYRDIPELAESIKTRGQLQSIGIDKDYNIIFGHRRYYAAVHLMEKKNHRIKLKVHLIQGDRKTLQAIENFHQSKMTASEEEQCIESFIADGMKQKEIAEYLCLTPQRVNDMRAAGRVRESVESKGTNTKGISSSALSAMRSVDLEKMEDVIQKANESGGTSVGNIKKAVKEVSKPKKTISESLMQRFETPENIGTDIIAEAFYLTVKCLANCKNRTENLCSLKFIEILSVYDGGLCSNFEEV